MEARQRPPLKADDIISIHKDLAAGATHVSVPSLFVQVQAYMFEWFIWGYYGIPYKETKTK